MTQDCIVYKCIPSKLLTSTVTPNFDRVSQIIVKILGVPQFKMGNLSQKLFYVLLPYIIYVMQSGRFSLYPAFRQKSGTKSTA
jgi:hypothetical protein